MLGGRRENSPEMKVYAVTGVPTGSLGILRRYQFTVTPGQAKGTEPIEFRLRCSYKGITSNWVDCGAGLKRW